MPTFGAISKSRVLLAGAAVTGSLNAAASITITPAACGSSGGGFRGCRADIDGDGTVSGTDLASLLGAWDACSCCPSDLTADGQVDGAVLATLLGSWGLCP